MLVDSRTVLRIAAMVLVLVALPFAHPVRAEASDVGFQEWVLEDAWIRFESGDYEGAADAFIWATALDPASEWLWEFPVGRLPDGLAGLVIVDMIQLVEREAAETQSTMVLSQLMLGYLHYGLFAASAGYDEFAEKAALAIENLYYDFHHVEDLDFSLLQAAPALLRSLVDVQIDPTSSLWRLRAVQHHISSSWWSLELCLLRYADYWAPLLQHEEWDEISPSGISFALEWYPDLEPYNGGFPDLEGQLHNGLLPTWDLVLGELEDLTYAEGRQLLLEAMFDSYQEWAAGGSFEYFEETLRLAGVLTQWDPQCFEAWFVTAQLLAVLKDDPGALEAATDALIRTLDLAPRFLEAQLLLAQLLMEQGRFFSAADQYKFIIAEFGDNLITGAVTAPLALAYAADGRITAGVLYFEQLLAAHETPAVLLPLAVLYGVDRQYQKAMNHVERVIEHPEASHEQREYAQLLWDEFEMECCADDEHSEGM